MEKSNVIANAVVELKEGRRDEREEEETRFHFTHALGDHDEEQ